MSIATIKIKKTLTGKKAVKFTEFLNYYKRIVGLSDWNIILALGKVDDGFMAQIEVDLLEKILTICIREEFFKYDASKQKNILFHELVHGRVSVFNLNMEKIKDTQEEDMVNDLVRGVERIKGLKFKGEKK